MAITSTLPSAGLKNGDYFTITKCLNTNDKSYIGDIFEVRYVEGYYVRCIRYSGKVSDNQLKDITLDLREIVIKSVSDAADAFNIITKEVESRKIKYKPIKLVIANEI